MTLNRLLIALASVVLAAPGLWAQPAPDVAPLAAPLAAPGADTAAPTLDAGLLQRVVVLGSSASAGFKTPATLNLMFDPMIAPDHEPVMSCASSLFFMEPEQTGERLAATAAAHEPSLVIALDYLFWFGYGDLPSEHARLVLLEQGLENLERFDCPVIVSPYPVVTAAVGKILYPAQIPEDATLEALDERVLEWVEDHDNAYIVSVPQIYARLMKQPPDRIAGQTWPVQPGATLMQDDALHPTLEGMTAVAALILADLVRQGLIPDDSVDLDLAACLARVTGTPSATDDAQAPAVPATER